MFNKFSIAAISTAFLFSITSNVSAIGGCLNVSGKIYNNSITETADSIFNELHNPEDDPELAEMFSGLLSTLGVAHFNILGAQNLKCGIIGIPTQNSFFGPGPHFVHTISCNDKVGGLQAHSQLSFDTEFTSLAFPGGEGGITVEFEEESFPRVNSGKGIFENITNGYLTIVGTVNLGGGIDMDFSGELCPD